MEHEHHDHDHHHHHEHKEMLNTPVSIIIAAIIIAGAMIYANQNLTKSISGGVKVVTGTAQTTQQQAAQGTGQQGAVGSKDTDIKVRPDAAVMGNKNAKVTMVEFSDFQCPYCQNFFKTTFPQIKSKYIDTGKVKLVYMHYPLSFHVNAEISGVAAECANRQGKFWEYHDILFANAKADGTNLDKDSLKKYADQLKLNAGTLGFAKNKFNQCIDGSEASSTVAEDLAEGSRIGITGTPSFTINGKLIVGAQPYATFEQAIEEALK